MFHISKESVVKNMLPDISPLLSALMNMPD